MLLLFFAGCSSPANTKEAGIYQAKITSKKAYKDAFMMGVALNEEIVSGEDKASQQIAVQQFNTITVENVMKAGPINPEPGQFNFGPADDYLAFGKEHDMLILGHTLVWHNQTPDWFFQDESVFSMRKEIRSIGKPSTFMVLKDLGMAENAARSMGSRPKALTSPAVSLFKKSLRFTIVFYYRWLWVFNMGIIFPTSKYPISPEKEFNAKHQTGMYNYLI